MDKLLAESRLDCPPEQQIQVLERCLQVVTTKTNESRRKLGWLLLARVLERCSVECLRAGQSRLGKRLVDISSRPTLSSAIFVRQLLVRNPQTGELHANTVEKIVLSLLDQSVRDECPELREISAEIFAIRYGSSKSEVLLATLEALLRQKFISSKERRGLLNISCLGMAQHSSSLTEYLFYLLSVTFEYARQGELLNRDKFLDVIELGLNSTVARDSALSTLEAFCQTAQKAALPVIPLISSMLVSQLKEPSSALFSALAEISTQYGASSTLHKHFYVIFEVLKHPLDQQSYGDAAARLVASIVRSSSFLIQPEILVAVQQTICRHYANHPTSATYRPLVGAFLTNTHPLIPPPVHVARSILKNHPDEMLSSICDLISRPRTMNLNAKRVLDKTSTMQLREENPIPVEEIKEEPAREQIVERVENPTPIAPPQTPATSEATPVLVEPTTSWKPTPKVEKRPVSEPKAVPPATKKTKKPETKTVLHDGEQSVDDIFDSFIV